jgi:hypothetical protein
LVGEEGSHRREEMNASNANDLTLRLLRDTLAVSRLEPAEAVPDWARGEIVSITRTPDELSIVCSSALVPARVRCERGWRAFRVEGVLDLELTGIALALSAPLASAGVPVFLISTFDTDYLLVRERDLASAERALSAAGVAIEAAPEAPGLP